MVILPRFRADKINIQLKLFLKYRKLYVILTVVFEFPTERVNIMLLTIFTVLQLISAVIVTVIVLMQSGKSAGLSGAIAGGADTFLSKGKAKTLDAKLAKSTKWIGLAFVILTLALNLL